MTMVCTKQVTAGTDIGGGAGAFVTGLDTSTTRQFTCPIAQSASYQNIAAAAHRLDDTELDSEDQSFDVVLGGRTIEHLSDLVNALGGADEDAREAVIILFVHVIEPSWRHRPHKQIVGRAMAKDTSKPTLPNTC